MRGFHHICLILLCASASQADSVEKYIAEIAPLVSATNTADAIPSQFPRIIYWLSKATKDNSDVNKILDVTLGRATTNTQLIELTKKLLLNNLNLAKQHGCLDEDGLSRMRQGQPPIIQSDTHTGKPFVVKAVISVLTCPELRNLLANYEFKVPKASRSSIVTRGERARQQIFVDSFREAGVLSAESYKRFMAGESTL